MAQKWNLGDIVPPDRNRRTERPATAGRPLSDMRRTGGAHVPPHRPLPHQVDHYAHEPVDHEQQEETLDEEVRDLEITIGRSSRVKRVLLIGTIVCAAIGIGIGSTMLMAGADVTIMPKSKVVTVNGTLEAKKSAKAGELGYEVLAYEETGERTVKATGQEKVSERASGTMTITNAFSQTKQRLVKNTRFESPNGLIYRITESVEVPGFTKSSDGSITPGVATAKVLADGTGDQYNLPPSKFTIPGLKGSDQYSKVLGETKEAMVGGFEGMKFIIDEGELSKTRQELHLELRDKLFARLKSERPNGFVFYEPSVTFVYDSLPPKEASDQSVTLTEKARLMAPLFKQDAFASLIAKRAVPGYEGEAIRIEDPSTLTFGYPATSTDLSSSDGFEFTLGGQTKLIWVYDQEKLRSDLAGVAQSALPTIFAGYPAIEQSRAIIKPFWRDTFPTDIEKIRIIESFDAFK